MQENVWLFGRCFSLSFQLLAQNELFSQKYNFFAAPLPFFASLWYNDTEPVSPQDLGFAIEKNYSVYIHVWQYEISSCDQEGVTG